MKSLTDSMDTFSDQLYLGLNANSLIKTFLL